MDMLNPAGRVYCGYCLGDALFNQDKTRWEHATDGERITNISAGDYVSAAHNRAGTKINAVDLIDDSEAEENSEERHARFHLANTGELPGGSLNCSECAG